MTIVDDAGRMDNLKDELAQAGGKVTPGVDNGPYIQYALDALTRGRQSSSTSQVPLPSQTSEACSEPDSGRGPSDGQTASASSAVPRVQHDDLGPSKTKSPPRNWQQGASHPLTRSDSKALPTTTMVQWVPVDKNKLQTIDPRGCTYPPLTYKPRTLRPASMVMLMSLCTLLTTGLVYCAVRSREDRGLTPYSGSIYSGQYFLFRILPQVLAAIILIHAQHIVTTSLRILPYATLAKEDPRERYNALFQRLYPTSFLMPHLSGPWQMKLFGAVTWLMNFTLPLLSAAFTCIYDEDEARWEWAAADGVLWTSIAFYVLLLVSTCTLMTYGLGLWTGLSWDARSIADLIPLLHRSNTMRSYRRSRPPGQSYDFRSELRERWFDRLGYWQMEDMMTGGVWHAIGSSTASNYQGKEKEGCGLNPFESSEGRSSGVLDGSSECREAGSSALVEGGGSYLPWCLKDLPLVSYALVTGSLLLALLIVSFLPQTQLEAGFAPLLGARPNSSAFSAANFLYSFLPATLGMILFLLFQRLDQALRVLQPWADMRQTGGAVASRSILADYAACLPLQASWKAARNGHWRIATTSLLSGLFVFLSVLGGGLFMALTTPEHELRMFPNMAVFGVLLALLVLYMGCLFLLLPRRQQFCLPHSVESIASLISSCTAQDLCEDAAFRSIRSREDLVDRLGVGCPDDREESVWFFGLRAGSDEKRLSVRRMR